MPEPVAVLYRVSTARQAKRDGKDDMPTQIRIIGNYVAAHDMVVVREYREEGVSAFHTDVSDREILRRILTDAQLGLFRTLLVFKADRLSRQAMGYPVYLHQLRKVGVRVISVSENRELSIDDHTDMLVRFLEGWLAEGESRNKSIHVSAHMREKAKTGQYLGGRPAYGFQYDKKTKTFAVYEPEAQVLRYAFERIFDVGLVQICKELNARGLCTRLGTPWGQGALGRVMRNPLVAGLRAYGKSRATGKGRNRTKTGDTTAFERLIIPRDENGNPLPDTSLAIVPLDTWLAAMEAMKSRRTRRGGPGSRSLGEGLLLTGFARCASCGGSMATYRYSKWVGGKRKTYEGYQCIRRKESGNSVCKGQRYFSASKVDPRFLAELENFLSELNPQSLSAHFERQLWDFRSEANRKTREVEKELKQSKKLLREWLGRLDKYLLQSAASLYSEDILAAKVKEYEERVATLEAQLNRIRQENAVRNFEQEQLRMFANLVPRWFDLFKAAPLRQKKQMLRTIVDTVEIGRGSLTINCTLNILAFIHSARGDAPSQGGYSDSSAGLVLPFRLVASSR